MKKYHPLFSISFAALFVLLFGMSGCKSSQDPAMLEQEAQAYDALTEIITNGNFRVEVEVVQPFYTTATTQVLNQLTPYSIGNTTGNINVRGEGHFLEVAGEHVVANMPFFGEQFQSGGRILNRQDVGVSIDGTASDWEQRTKERKQQLLLEFNVNDANNSAENYNIVITAFSSKRASIIVTSSQRSHITYHGKLVETEGKAVTVEGSH